MSTFQLTLIGLFIFFLIFGVLVFSGILPGFRPPQGGQGGTVTLWGTFAADDFDGAFESFREAHKGEFTLNYEAKDARTLSAELVEALASGAGPDLVILPQAELYAQLNKLLPLPYEAFPERNFRDAFIREAELYLGQDGIFALPTVVDPLVMFVNKDLLAAARLPQVPKTWADLQAVIKNLTIADAAGNLTQSAIALGHFQNVAHAKDILAMLMMQAGNPIVAGSEAGLGPVLRQSLGFAPGAGSPTLEALAFFGRFADPANSLYSWNSAQPNSRDAFARGQLAFYLGYASEWPRLRQQNPQLNFDVAQVPQPAAPSGAAASRTLTFGRLYGVSVLKGSSNPVTAWQGAGLLAGAEGTRTLSALTGLPAARNDQLGALPREPEKTVFNQAAIVSRGWWDPAPAETERIFRQLIEQIQIRRVQPAAALEQAEREMSLLFKK